MEDGATDVVESLVPSLNLNSEDVEEKKEGVVKVKEKDLGGGAGLINNLISTLITPLSPSIGKATNEHDESDADDDGGDHGESGGVDHGHGGDQGGLISKMVSNFFHQSEGEGEGVVDTEKDKEEEEIMAGEKIKLLKTQNGGIIHNIVSHLPASIPDDAVPTAEEATFLINSLVRD